MAALYSDHYRQAALVGAGCFTQVAAALHSDHYRQVLLEGAGSFRQVAALHSDHYRQVPLVEDGCDYAIVVMCTEDSSWNCTYLVDRCG